MICLDVIGIEACEEVASDDLSRAAPAAKGIGDELQILFQGFLAENCRDKRHEPTDNIIIEIFIVAYWEDGILIRHERRILAAIPCAPGIGKPRRIEGVAAKHAADGVGDQAPNIAWEIGSPHSHILVLDLGREFIREAVDVDKDAIEFFLIFLQCGKAIIAIPLPVCIAIRKKCDRFFALCRVDTIGKLLAAFVRHRHKRMGLEIP